MSLVSQFRQDLRMRWYYVRFAMGYKNLIVELPLAWLLYSSLGRPCSLCPTESILPLAIILIEVPLLRVLILKVAVEIDRHCHSVRVEVVLVAVLQCTSLAPGMITTTIDS